MKEDISADETGIKVSKAPFIRFFKYFMSPEKDTEKFTEKISQYEKNYSEDGDLLFKNKHSKEEGKKKEGDRREFFIFFVFVKSFYIFKKE